MKSRVLTLLLLGVCLSVACRKADADGDAPLNFGRQIAPIFEEHCVRCHSTNNSKGDLSLATMDDLREQELIVRGDPDASHLIAVISDSDGERPAMPKEGQPLSQGEVELLRKWIAEGATWPKNIVIKEKSKADSSWWAYQPLNHPNDKSAIDDFIREKLSEVGLKMSTPADRRTLIRRLSFDLHGLPPTPDAVGDFVNDPDPKAYEKLVDRMLASHHYGVRYAQHWLDIAHYADTHGFERDKRRDNAWRYRDYVIDALNEDKPYNRFLQEQIAGDVLWPDDTQAVIATGFLAAGPWDFVGQVETKSPVLRRSARSLDLDDMATQVMTATMAMTVNCARCHDHKLDPISQREYYQLRAVFAGIKREDRVVSDAALQRYNEKKRELAARRDKIDFEIGRLEGEGLDLADIVGGGNGLGTGTYRNALDPRTAKVQTRNFGFLGNVVTNKYSKSDFPFVDGVFIPDGKDGTAQIPISSTGLKISGLPKTSGAAWDMIRNGPVASQHSNALDGIDFTQNGHSLIGLHANAGITFDLSAIRRAVTGASSRRSGDVGRVLLPAADEQTGKSARPTVSENRSTFPLPHSPIPPLSTPLRFTSTLGYFGATGNNLADAWVFVDGQKVAEFRNLGRADGLKQIDVELPAEAKFLTLVSTDGGNGIGHDQIGFGDPKIRLAKPPTLSEADQQHLTTLRKQRKQLDEQIEFLGPPPRFYGVVGSDSVPKTYLLTRGSPETPDDEALAPAAFSTLQMLDPALGGIESPEGKRRAALARWITDDANPLVRRVIVNRLWHWHFGKGLVDTPSDFGYGGSRPSHPELLDWLADQFAKNDWSLKEIHRLILNSETYKQVSARSYARQSVEERVMREGPPSGDGSYKRAASIDADNRLLWRQNPRRLDAETIRDAVLFVSGKLNPKRGGPGFEDFEYQDAYAPIYTYVTADKPPLWRRSIYRYIVRTTPNRFLTTLDCPDPANLTAKRLTTTTPLQSLALYNNDFMLRQARYFAERITGVEPEVDQQINAAFTLALGRNATSQEFELSRTLVMQQGLNALTRSLFNANEFVYVD